MTLFESRLVVQLVFHDKESLLLKSPSDQIWEQFLRGLYQKRVSHPYLLSGQYAGFELRRGYIPLLVLFRK